MMDGWLKESKFLSELNVAVFVKKRNSSSAFIDPEVHSILLVDHMDWPRYP